MLRRGSLGVRFRRQHPIGPFVVDFYCAARLVVELDGGVHHDALRAEADFGHQRMLERTGRRVLRFANADVFHALDSVVAAIRLEVEARTTPPPGPLLREEGEA